MSTKKAVAAVVVALALSVVGWNVAWRYDEARIPPYNLSRKIRTHLVTGEAQMLTSAGWATMRPMRTSAPVAVESPQATGSPNPYDDIVSRAEAEAKRH